MDNTLLIVIASLSVAAAVLLLFFAIVQTNKSSKGTEDFDAKLKELNRSELEEKEEENDSLIDRWTNHWDSEALKSGVHAPPGTVGRVLFFIMIVSLMIGFLVIKDGAMFGVIGAILTPFAANAFFERARKTREKKLTSQLPYFIGQMRANNQANYTPAQAILSVVDDIPAPLGVELQIFKQDLEVGLTLDAALTRLTERVPSRELRFLCNSIKIANLSGADLEPQLIVINDLIDDRRSVDSKRATAMATVSSSILVSVLAIPAFFLFTFFTTEGAPQFWFGAEGLPYLAIIVLLYAASIIITRKHVNDVSEF